MPNSARVDREKRAKGMIANLAISPTSRIQEISESPTEVLSEEPAKEQAAESAKKQVDELLNFLNIDFEMVNTDKVNNTLLTQSKPKPLGLTKLDLNSLRKVVEKLHSLRF